MKNVSAFLKRHSALLLLVLVLATVPAGIAFGKYVKSVNVTNEISIKVSVATSANEYTINKTKLKNVLQGLDNPATALYFVKGSGVPKDAVQVVGKDIQASGSGRIFAYQKGTYIYIAPADHVDAPLHAPEDSSYFLSVIYNDSPISAYASSIEKLKSIKCDNLDTSGVTDMSYMFYGCKSLSSLDLSSFDTSKVTTMHSMFEECSGLTSLNVSSFDTSSVTTMCAMFEECSGLTSLNVSNFDTSSVTSMSYIFKNCSSLTSLDVSNFKTSNVTNMELMFYGCKSLSSLDLRNFITSEVTNMGDMFEGCSGLTSLNVSSFDTSSVTIMSCMFRMCSSLTSLDLSKFNTSNVATMQQMFFACKKLETINASNKFTTGKVINSSDMFAYCTSLVGGNGTTYDSSKTDMTYARIDGGTNNPGYFTGDATSTLSVTGSNNAKGISFD